MDLGIASIIVAIIGFCGTVFGAVFAAFKEFKSLKKQNSYDHEVVMAKLDDVKNGVDRVAQRLDDHIDWHLDRAI